MTMGKITWEGVRKEGELRMESQHVGGEPDLRRPGSEGWII